MKRKNIVSVILAALLSSVCMSTMAAENKYQTFFLDKLIVEADAYVPGEYVNNAGAVGIMGKKSVMRTPFSVTNIAQKNLDVFLGPNEPLDKALVGVPSVRASGSILHGDFSVRGFRSNGTSMYVNGVHGVMTQFNLPMFAMEGIDIVSGPNSMLGSSGVQYESNTAGGIINARSKRAGKENFIKYKQTFSGKGSYGEYLDVSQRLGKDNAWGVRLNTELLNGETAVNDANMKAKGVAVNIDHNSKKSNTNLFANYRDLDIYNGIRWFKLANGGTYKVSGMSGTIIRNIPGVTGLPDAPDGGRNYAAEGTWKAGYGWFATLNHEQYLSDRWSLFANFGYSRQKLNQNISPNMSSYWLTDDLGNYDLIQTNSATPQRSYYAQVGSKNKFNTGDVKHEIIFSADKAWRNRNGSNTVPGSRYLGQANIYSGILNQEHNAGIIGYTTRPNNKTALWGISVLDNMEYGKWNLMLGWHKHGADARSWDVKNKVYKSVKSSASCPTYSLSYRPEESVLIYGNHAENFDIGTAAGSSYANAGEVLPPSKTKQDEVGIKYAVKNGIYTLAYFDIDQAGNVSVNKDGKNYFVQDGRVNHKGVEFSYNGKIAGKWYGMVGAAYMDARYKNMGTASYKNGKRVSGQGFWNASAALEYKADDKFSVIGRATYTGRTPFYTVNYNTSTVTDKSKQLQAPAYTVIDLGVIYNTKINNTPVKLSAMCYNLLNKDYWIVARGDQVYLSTPRTFSLAAEFKI